MTSHTTPSTPQDSTTQTYPVDSEHGALRLVVVAVFIGAGFISYLILSGLISGEEINLLVIILSFGSAYLVTTLVERVLRTHWPSGRVVEISERGVRTAKHGSTQQEILASQDATPLMWRFQTRRRSRVPKGWHVLALALEQDGQFVTVYTFVSPDELTAMGADAQFTELKSKKETDRGTKGRDALLLAGEQRRLLQAEGERWVSGAEMTSADFKALLAQLGTRFPQWMSFA